MSETLERIMQLKNMGLNLGMNPQQKRAAQGDAIMRVGAEMGNPHHAGSGFDRLLNVMNASIQPASAAYDQAEQRAIEQNTNEMEMLRKLDSDEQEAKRLQRREMLEALKMKKDEEYNQRYLDIMASKNNIVEGSPEPIDLGHGMRGVPFSTLSKQNQSYARKKMYNDISIAHAEILALKALNGMKEILKEHPNMSEYYMAYLADPEKAGKFWETVKRKVLIPTKQIEAVQTFGKLSSDLILFGAQTLPGGRSAFTDQKQKLIEQSKPLTTNQLESNLFVINRMLERYKHAPLWKKALEDGLANGYEVIGRPEDSADEGEGSNEEEGVKSPIKDLSPEQLLEIYNKKRE